MRDAVERLMSKLNGQSSDSDVWESLLVIGSLLDKAHITNASDSYRLEELGDELSKIRLSETEVREIISALDQVLIAGSVSAKSEVLWAMGKFSSPDSLCSIVNFLHRERGCFSEEECYQALVGLQNIVFDDHANLLQTRPTSLAPILKDMSNGGSARVKEIAERLLDYLKNPGGAASGN